MKIDQRKLKELYCKIRSHIAKDERFYAIPGTKDYALSTYCRVAKHKKDGWYQIIRSQGYDYLINFDNQEQKQQINIRQLAARVFFPDFTGGYLETAPNIHGKQEWKIENMHLLLNQEMIVENWLAKMKHREPDYSEEYKHHSFINRWEPNTKKSINEHLNSIYRNIKSRSTNLKVKENNPAYRDTSICEEWKDNPSAFKQWFLDHQYYYQDRLEVDKDLMNFGETNEYAQKNCCILPRYINDIFFKGKSELGYCISKIYQTGGILKYQIPGNAFGGGEKTESFNSYFVALVYGRKRKANYIRKVVEDERQRGLMPEYILNKMLDTAKLIEYGCYKSLEPSAKTILEETK